VWLLMGFRAGDNAQVAALAEALGWPYEIKRLVYRNYELVTNRLLGPTLAGVDRKRSDSLTPPWPDLVITAGRRNEPVARWIQNQAAKRICLVHLGRPWAPVECFDLVVTTPQYQVPQRSNVLQIAAPLHAVTPARLSEAAARWHSVFEPLPRPWVAVLVGGDSPPYVFDAEAAGRLGRAVTDLARQQGGTVLVTTSPRTGRPAAEVLHKAIGVPCHFHGWTPDPSSNPYLAYLALADSIVVTGESMSMVAEACATGKPVYLFDMGRGWTRMRPPGAPGELPQPLTLLERLQPRRMLHWALAHGLPTRIRRDVRRLLSQLVASGHACWLGDSAQPANPLPLDDLARAVARTKAFF
jgi:mitochondrial fission protein ELM1